MREANQFQRLLSYNDGEFDWIKSNKTGEWLLVGRVENRNCRLRPDQSGSRKSSYLSWVLENDAPLSELSRVFSLSIHEENFWNQMVDQKTGYLRLYTKGENVIQLKKMEETMRQNLKQFRDNICLALLFINVCFFVLNVTLKANQKELPGAEFQISISLLSYGQYDDFFEWQRDELVIGGVSESVLEAFNANLTCADVDMSVVKALATKLLLEDDYKMKCVDYFRNLNANCDGVTLEFPILYVESPASTFSGYCSDCLN